MSKKIEDFIRDRKDEFEDHKPSDALWQRIEKRLDNKNVSQAGKVISIKIWMKVAAAAVIILGVSTVFYILNNSEPTTTELALENTDSLPAVDSNIPFREEEKQLATNIDTPVTNDLLDRKKTELADLGSNSNEEELYHYTRLIEIKQGQMKELKKTEPELYKEFSKDIEMLETSYDALKAQFKNGVNSEKLLEAMIGNLKMQADLLNKQLTILKEVHTKKNKDDKDYKNL
ncbi:hypothetical protein [Niabella ginsengisoli]|uniref:Anti-sigma factor n=1 Tax=Niabella ginsengisoli TaxID=522298 RepID=A0ABS9SI93_9BACT|nr:hypothetical protein [Niabella ginsengisoli]MCH5598065.1 hypothetical protein [Niabella ginsengisoli]